MAALAVAGGLMGRRDGVLVPLLQSLALLLSQNAPGGRDRLWTPRQRSLLGSWAFVCVVVGAAYSVGCPAAVSSGFTTPFPGARALEKLM